MFLAILFSVNMESQITIEGKKEPEAFSVLELINKGRLRLPQMTTAERNAFTEKIIKEFTRTGKDDLVTEITASLLNLGKLKKHQKSKIVPTAL